MTDLIPVTVIEHQGPFPPTAYDLYLTYQYAGWTPKEQE